MDRGFQNEIKGIGIKFTNIRDEGAKGFQKNYLFVLLTVAAERDGL